MQISMVGFVLKNTLSENGGVTRGVCKVDANQMLTEIVETSNIVKDTGRCSSCNRWKRDTDRCGYTGFYEYVGTYTRIF